MPANLKLATVNGKPVEAHAEFHPAPAALPRPAEYELLASAPLPRRSPQSAQTARQARRSPPSCPTVSISSAGVTAGRFAGSYRGRRIRQSTGEVDYNRAELVLDFRSAANWKTRSTSRGSCSRRCLGRPATPT